MDTAENDLSTADVARIAGVHRDTLLRWLREGLVPEPRRDRHGWRIFGTREAKLIAQFARSATKPDSAFTPDISKLDAIDWDFRDAKTTYLTHGMHPYPAKFIPQIPNALIQTLSSVGETVADIFCGSGTTLVESLVLKRNAIGIDANPLACLISRAKTALLEDADSVLLESMVERACRLAEAVSDERQLALFADGKSPFKAPVFVHDAIQFWFEPFVIQELSEILSWCRELPTLTSRTVALSAFSSIVVSVSKQDSDTRYVRREKNLQRGDALRRFSRALAEASNSAKQFTELAEPRFRSRVYEANLLDRPEIGSVDLVVCSPPYPNAYSYHLYHMTRMVWLGMDHQAFKTVEIGSHRKYSRRGPKRAGVETFGKEMRTIFSWLGQHLKRDRFACFVVGNSILNGKVINNSDLIAPIARDCGFVELKRIHRNLQETKKAFNPAYGKIKTEHIVVFQNQNGARQ
jgi:DNA modification methylase